MYISMPTSCIPTLEVHTLAAALWTSTACMNSLQHIHMYPPQNKYTNWEVQYKCTCMWYHCAHSKQCKITVLKLQNHINVYKSLPGSSLYKHISNRATSFHSPFSHICIHTPQTQTHTDTSTHLLVSKLQWFVLLNVLPQWQRPLPQTLLWVRKVTFKGERGGSPNELASLR